MQYENAAEGLKAEKSDHCALCGETTDVQETQLMVLFRLRVECPVVDIIPLCRECRNRFEPSGYGRGVTFQYLKRGSVDVAADLTAFEERNKRIYKVLCRFVRRKIIDILDSPRGKFPSEQELKDFFIPSPKYSKYHGSILLGEIISHVTEELQKQGVIERKNGKFVPKSGFVRDKIINGLILGEELPDIEGKLQQLGFRGENIRKVVRGLEEKGWIEGGRIRVDLELSNETVEIFPNQMGEVTLKISTPVQGRMEIEIDGSDRRTCEVMNEEETITVPLQGLGHHTIVGRFCTEDFSGRSRRMVPLREEKWDVEVVPRPPQVKLPKLINLGERCEIKISKSAVSDIKHLRVLVNNLPLTIDSDGDGEWLTYEITHYLNEPRNIVTVYLDIEGVKSSEVKNVVQVRVPPPVLEVEPTNPKLGQDITVMVKPLGDSRAYLDLRIDGNAVNPVKGEGITTYRWTAARKEHCIKARWIAEAIASDIVERTVEVEYPAPELEIEPREPYLFDEVLIKVRKPECEGLVVLQINGDKVTKYQREKCLEHRFFIKGKSVIKAWYECDNKDSEREETYIDPILPRLICPREIGSDERKCVVQITDLSMNAHVELRVNNEIVQLMRKGHMAEADIFEMLRVGENELTCEIKCGESRWEEKATVNVPAVKKVELEITPHFPIVGEKVSIRLCPPISDLRNIRYTVNGIEISNENAEFVCEKHNYVKVEGCTADGIVIEGSRQFDAEDPAIEVFGMKCDRYFADMFKKSSSPLYLGFSRISHSELNRLLTDSPRKDLDIVLLIENDRDYDELRQHLPHTVRHIIHDYILCRADSRIHFKLMSDGRRAIVTSANLTKGGLKRNKEMGIYISVPSLAKEVCGFLRYLAGEGSYAEEPIDGEKLRNLMQAKFITSLENIPKIFKLLAENAGREIVIVSPEITERCVRQLLENSSPHIEIKFVGNITEQGVRRGVVEKKALNFLMRRGATIFHATNLHAKALIVDGKWAVVSSANITGKKLYNAGILLQSEELVSKIVELVERYKTQKLGEEDISNLPRSRKVRFKPSPIFKSRLGPRIPPPKGWELKVSQHYVELRKVLRLLWSFLRKAFGYLRSLVNRIRWTRFV